MFLNTFSNLLQILNNNQKFISIFHNIIHKLNIS
ncbi:hypothetical protein JHZ67_29620 [Pseudomonas syringae pv. maculicola]|nr:hypothetical protein [Pseudomonas syringae pv. maculicola]